jgi:hypothetical protein
MRQDLRRCEQAEHNVARRQTVELAGLDEDAAVECGGSEVVCAWDAKDRRPSAL